MRFWKVLFASPFLTHAYYGGLVVRDSAVEQDYLLAGYLLISLGALSFFLFFVLFLLGSSCESTD